MEKQGPLTGKRYVNLLRCSTLKQGDKSIPDQKKVNDAFAREQGMIWVRDREMPGVSASKTFSRRDLDGLLREALELRDFDVLLVHDLSRLTRGGIRHALQVKRQFEKAGVLVISASDNLPEGEEGEFYEAFLHWKNKWFAKQLGREAARGSRSSLEKGTRPHCAHTPFGFDRLYCGPDGTKRYVLRQLDQRTRVVLDYATGATRDTLYADAEGRFIPFQKQRDETSKLILGSDEVVAAVRKLFEMRYKLGLSFRTITIKFNEMSVKPFHAPYWRESSLHKLCHNAIYLGRAIACRWALGYHYVLGQDRPQVTPIKQADFEDTGRISVEPIHRPPNEWFEREEEHLLHFLNDPEVRRKAEAAIAADLEKFNRPRTPRGAHLKGKGFRGNHRDTPYILRDLLRTTNGNLEMTGRTLDQTRRTYYVKNYLNHEPDALHLFKYVPAPPVEVAVLSVLRDVLQRSANLEVLIGEAILREQSEGPKDTFDEATLRAEDKSLARKTAALVNASPDPEEAVVQEQLKAWKLRRQQIKRQLDGASLRTRKFDVKAFKTEVLKTLLLPADDLDGESRFRLRNLVNAWCQDMRIDIETREFEFTVRVPSGWAVEALMEGRDLCMEYNFTRQFVFDAQKVRSAILGRFRCPSPFPGRPVRKWPHKWAYTWEQIKATVSKRRSPKK